MNERRKTFFAAIIALGAVGAAISFVIRSSAEPEHDPHEHIDAPGYYNGPMGPHGTNSKAGGNRQSPAQKPSADSGLK